MHRAAVTVEPYWSQRYSRGQGRHVLDAEAQLLLAGYGCWGALLAALGTGASRQLARILLGACLGAAAAAPAAHAQATGPLNTMTLPRMESRVDVRRELPSWVALPPTARILTSDGLDLRPMRNSAVTWENARVGVLVGALANTGRCATDVRAFLQYTNDRWQPVGDPIESEARVSQVDPGGAFPYRFRLKRAADFDEPPSGYILQVVEDGRPVADTLQWVSGTRRVDATPCAAPRVTLRTDVSTSRPTLRGYQVTGTVTVVAGGPLRPDALTLTALLRDEAGDVLEVLTGVPAVPRDLAGGVVADGQSVRFTLSTDIPIGKAVKATTVFAETLDDAKAAAPPE